MWQKLWCDASFKNGSWKMSKRSSGAKLPSKIQKALTQKPPKPDLHGAADPTMIQDRSETVARQTLLQHLWRHVLYEKTQHFGAGYLSKTHFVRGFLQKWKLEDVKTKLWCEGSFKNGSCKMWQKLWCDASFKNGRWKMWKRSCGAMVPPSWEGCEEEWDGWRRERARAFLGTQCMVGPMPCWKERVSWAHCARS